MGKRIIISESEKKNILSLYEQDSNEFKKENDFLKRYIGKTFNVYGDKNFQSYAEPKKIEEIIYDGVSLTIKTMLEDLEVNYTVNCLYNPSRFSYKISDYDDYNKTLIDDISAKGLSSGVKWCQKPKADFGIKSVNEDSNVAPPPSESILVANKNPFKYSEYVNARKFYSPTLKDGELFFEKNEKFNLYLEKELQKKMLGKTFRGLLRENEDVLIQIKDNLEVWTKDGKSVGTQCIYSLRFSGIIDGSEQDMISYYVDPGNEILYSNYSYTFNRDIGNSITLSNPQSFKSVIFSVSNWNLIPDELFQIRKIQRQKTDF